MVIRGRKTPPVPAGLIALVLVLGACGGSGNETPADGEDPPAIEESGGTETNQDDESAKKSAGNENNGAESAGESNGDGDTAATAELFPDVVGVEASQDGDGSWTFNVTLSSPYDSPQRYADAWRVMGPDGTVYGERILTHDHANEQPFTRSQSGIEIPDDIVEVTVQGRDQVSGWGGRTMTVTLAR
ncbi:MAG: hypothetical protein OER95_04080 [Acidimicrobiia bacterium]|nr:hypothetical protein [Acidimicrobiia bacterium]